MPSQPPIVAAGATYKRPPTLSSTSQIAYLRISKDSGEYIRCIHVTSAVWLYLPSPRMPPNEALISPSASSVRKMPRTRSSKPTAGPGSTISDATSYVGHKVEASTNEGLSQGSGQGLIESHCTYLAAVVSFVEGKTTPARAGRAHRSHSGCRRQKMSRLPGVDALAVMLPVQRGRQRHLLSYPRAQLARCGTATQLCHRFSRRPKGRLAHAQGETCEHRLWCGCGIYSSCACAQAKRAPA